MISLIETLYAYLLKKKIITDVFQVNTFYDEPGYKYFQTSLNASSKHVQKHTYNTRSLDIVTGGLSFSSPELGLLKCLAEIVERYCLISCRKKFTFTSYKKLSPNALDPDMYISGKRDQIFGWMRGKNLMTGKDAHIPAQLAYLTFRHFAEYELDREEPRLTQLISTGAAVGSSKEDAILRGLYEVAERDMAMSAYLMHRRLPKIDLASIDDPTIQMFLQACSDCKLEVQSFDMKNDLGIPGVVTFLLDKTGLGPEMTVGTEANLNVIDAIIGSADEAFMGRIWMRHEFHRGITGHLIHEQDIKTLRERTLFWTANGRFKHFSYLFSQQPAADAANTNLSVSQQIEKILASLKKHGYIAYGVDLSEKEFLPFGLQTHKVVVPGLQPLYMDERRKEVTTDRLDKIAKHFKIDHYDIQQIPHPFL